MEVYLIFKRSWQIKMIKVALNYCIFTVSHTHTHTNDASLLDTPTIL